MNANNAKATKSIGSTIDSLFDVDALIKAAASHAPGEGGGDISRVLRIASQQIRSIANDLDAIDLETQKPAMY